MMINGAKWEYGTLGLYVSELFLLFLMAFAFLKKKINIKMLPKSFLLMFVYASLTIFWAGNRGLALQSIFHAVAAVGFFLLLHSKILSRSEIIKWLLISAAAPSLLGLYQFFSQSTFSSTWLGLTKHISSEAGSSVIVADTIGRWLRAYGPFSHPNVLGGYLTAVLLLFLSSDFVDNRRWFYRIIALFATMALVLTLSRSAWLAFLIGMVVIGFEAWRKNNDQKLINVFAVSLMFFVTLGIIHGLAGNRIFLGSSNEINSITERVTGWQDAKKIIMIHPWGVGWGNYTAALIQANSGHPGWYYQPVHNVLLLILAEWGIPGFLFFLFWMILALKLVWRRFQSHAFLAGLIAIGLVDHYFYSGYAGGLVVALYFYGILSTIRPQISSIISLDA